MNTYLLPRCYRQAKKQFLRETKVNMVFATNTDIPNALGTIMIQIQKFITSACFSSQVLKAGRHMKPAESETYE